jgi:hypothetical protein
MHLIETLKVLSPLDVIVLTIEEQKIVKKKEVENCVPAAFLIDKAEKFLLLGEFPTRNVSYWNATQGKEKSETADWELSLIKELSNSRMEISVQEMDNTKSIVQVSCEIYMIAHNCILLTKELLKEVKCARVHTAFGPIEVEI